MSTTSLELPHPLILLGAHDNVAVAREDIAAGSTLHAGDRAVVSTQAIPAGHKIALQAIATGDVVRKYGQVIGVATQPIAAGAHVHTTNMDMSAEDRAHGVGKCYKPSVPVARPATFEGFVRPNGRVGTRNYLGVIASRSEERRVGKECRL